MSYPTTYFEVATTGINSQTITSEVTLFVPQWDAAPDDVVCFVGTAEGLESDLKSTYGGGGSDCTAGNGCGTHIHSGFGCANSTAQGGHWFDFSVVPVDPWIQIGYKLTNASGTAEFSDCVQVGFDVKGDPGQLEGRAFIIHKNDGSRGSCGLITKTCKTDKSAKCGKAGKSSKA